MKTNWLIITICNYRVSMLYMRIFVRRRRCRCRSFTNHELRNLMVNKRRSTTTNLRCCNTATRVYQHMNVARAPHTHTTSTNKKMNAIHKKEYVRKRTANNIVCIDDCHNTIKSNNDRSAHIDNGLV